MYVCESCCETFESPLSLEEYRGECHGTPAYEEISLSPCCHDSYDEAAICGRCGRYAPEHLFDCGLCPDCQTELSKETDEIISDFTPTEREYVLSLIESRFF